MMVVGVRQAKADLSSLAKRAKRGERFLLTRHGKPLAVVVGVAEDDVVDAALRWDPEFWRDLERRRREIKRRSISLENYRRKISGR